MELISGHSLRFAGFIVAIIVFNFETITNTKTRDMSNQEYVEKFKEKHSITNEQMGNYNNETYVFRGLWVTIDDIKLDIDANIQTGQIELYAAEGTKEGFGSWLKRNYYE